MAEPRFHVPSTTEEVRLAYDENASIYARFEPLLEHLGLRRLRRDLIRRATGEVLEVAVGTGANLSYYSDNCLITAVDISEAMLERAQGRARGLGRTVAFRQMDAEHLAFADDRFDTVVSTMSTCTFIEPVTALREMKRTCKPLGRILLLEHGRSSVGFLARFQERREAKHARRVGCHWNRDPVALVRSAGLDTLRSNRHFFGVVYTVEAKPPSVAVAG